MTNKRFPGKTNHQGITTVFATVVMLILFSISCSKDKKDIVVVEYDPETTYTLKTIDTYMLISDSGLVRYRLLADESYLFGKASEPYWYFPEGFYFEKFDTTFQVEGSIKADTAYNWEKKSLWKLVGNVELINLSGDSIETSLMYWDQNEGKIYSDKYVRIIRADGTIITGIGFETTQEMNKYILNTAGGEFLMNESTPADSTRTDSTAVQQPRAGGSRRPTPPPHNPMNFAPARRNLPVEDSLHLDLLEERERLFENEREQLERIEVLDIDSLKKIQDIIEPDIEDIDQDLEIDE